MREIKFRGKRIDNKEWVYGYLYKLPLPNGEACMILTQDNNHLDNHLEPKYHLAFTLWVDLFVVDPATVGQYTGLKDRNGNEVYEGDILMVEGIKYPRYNIVSWDERKFMFCIDETPLYAYLHGDTLLREYVVCGNVFDNPDFIEKGGNNEQD